MFKLQIFKNKKLFKEYKTGETLTKAKIVKAIENGNNEVSNESLFSSEDKKKLDGLDNKIKEEINTLINSAPEALDTLKELAQAIDNDSSFATTINNKLTTITNDIDTLKQNFNKATEIINRFKNRFSGRIDSLFDTYKDISYGTSQWQSWLRNFSNLLNNMIDDDTYKEIANRDAIFNVSQNMETSILGLSLDCNSRAFFIDPNFSYNLDYGEEILMKHDKYIIKLEGEPTSTVKKKNGYNCEVVCKIHLKVYENGNRNTPIQDTVVLTDTSAVKFYSARLRKITENIIWLEYLLVTRTITEDTENYYDFTDAYGALYEKAYYFDNTNKLVTSTSTPYTWINADTATTNYNYVLVPSMCNPYIFTKLYGTQTYGSYTDYSGRSYSYPSQETIAMQTYLFNAKTGTITSLNSNSTAVNLGTKYGNEVFYTDANNNSKSIIPYKSKTDTTIKLFIQGNYNVSFTDTGNVTFTATNPVLAPFFSLKQTTYNANAEETTGKLINYRCSGFERQLPVALNFETYNYATDPITVTTQLTEDEIATPIKKTKVYISNGFSSGSYRYNNPYRLTINNTSYDRLNLLDKIINIDERYYILVLTFKNVSFPAIPVNQYDNRLISNYPSSSSGPLNYNYSYETIRSITCPYTNDNPWYYEFYKVYVMDPVTGKIERVDGKHLEYVLGYNSIRRYREPYGLEYLKPRI